MKQPDALTPAEIQEARDVFTAHRATADQLRENLKKDRDGQPIILAQVALLENFAEAPEQLPLLERELPLVTVERGKGSPADTIALETEIALSRGIKRARREGRSQRFTGAAKQVVVDERAVLDEWIEAQTPAYQDVERKLATYRNQQSPDGNLIARFLGKLFTQPVTAFEAASSFNRREELALDLNALRTARDEVLGRLQSYLDDSTENFEARLAEAEELLSAATRRSGGLTGPSEADTGVLWRVHVPSVAAALAGQVAPEDLEARLTTVLAEDPNRSLPEAVALVVAEFADKLLGGKRVHELIALEGSVHPEIVGDALDIAQDVLVDATDRVSLELTPGAAPFAEYLQITADGALPFAADQLTTATNGDPDTYALLLVQLGIAGDELRFVEQTRPALEAAARKRNVFAIPVLAETWAKQFAVSPAPAGPAPVAPASGMAAPLVPLTTGSNGQHEPA
jgi:hypothetical protein